MLGIRVKSSSFSKPGGLLSERSNARSKSPLLLFSLFCSEVLSHQVHGCVIGELPFTALHARESALQRAEGEKITRVKAAEAEAEARYLQGQGISRQRMVSDTRQGSWDDDCVVHRCGPANQPCWQF